MKYEIAPKSTEIQANWDDARLYCFSLNIEGKTGWRLPTKEELNEIYESTNDLEEYGWYWSSTEFNTSSAWLQDFNYADQDYYNKLGNYYVRAIRDLKDN